MPVFRQQPSIPVVRVAAGRELSEMLIEELTARVAKQLLIGREFEMFKSFLRELYESPASDQNRQHQTASEMLRALQGDIYAVLP